MFISPTDYSLIIRLSSPFASAAATYSAAPDKSGNPVTTIQTKTTEEYTGVKK